ncbi:methyltransferase [Actinomadura algeriensis]|uniref:Multifunctional cyclase/dehydratase/O-methyltransferase n=1 Tax=Actinomadura algeriensis TaxID=1679523 RepID=A0ABR9JK57_9ACTN|nr:methyltransferase [Actinomadura algeriensis]MBE1530520.1 multifunctional cyclase/dehydratase/O-methyltransferase [Actinomadura algeriensis]
MSERPADPAGAAGPPAASLRLQSLLDGMRVAKVVEVLAELQVADVLAGGALPVADIAAEVGADPDALYRVLRCAASHGVFTEEDERRFGLTPMAELLRTETKDSHRDLFRLVAGDLWWRPYGDLLETVRTGRPAAERVFGVPFYDHLRADPDAAALFDRAMTEVSKGQAQAILSRRSFTRYRRIADIGGGHGYFLAQVLKSSPAGEGVLLDLPDVVAGAPAVLDKHGVAGRVTVVPGSFFDELPTGCDAYLLKAVLINWPDDRAVRILRRVREAIGNDPHARLLVVEPVVPPGDVPDYSKATDIDMLAVIGGRQRSTAEWRRLLAAGGFDLIGEPVPGRREVLECRPLGESGSPGDLEPKEYS